MTHRMYRVGTPHGLPIEQKAIKAFGINRHEIDPVEFRNKCKEFGPAVC